MRENEGNEWGGLEQFPSVEVKEISPKKTLIMVGMGGGTVRTMQRSIQFKVIFISSSIAIPQHHPRSNTNISVL